MHNFSFLSGRSLIFLCLFSLVLAVVSSARGLPILFIVSAGVFLFVLLNTHLPVWHRAVFLIVFFAAGITLGNFPPLEMIISALLLVLFFLLWDGSRRSLLSENKLMEDLNRFLSGAKLPAEVARAAVECLGSMPGLENSAIFLHDVKKRKLVLLSGSRAFRSDLSMPVDRGICGRAVREKTIQTVYSLMEEKDYIDIGPAAVSRVAVPLLSGDTVSGVLIVDFLVKRDMTAPRIKTLESAARIISGPLERSILFERTARSLRKVIGAYREQRSWRHWLAARQENDDKLKKRSQDRETLALLLLEIFREPGALAETEALCKKLVEQIFEKLGYPNIYILVRDNFQTESGSLSFRIAAHCGLSQSQYVHVLKDDNLKGIWGEVIKTHAPYLCRNCESDPSYIMGNPATKSELAVPIFLKGKIWGLIDLQSDREDAFSEDDIQVLSFIATNLAILFENASNIAMLEYRGERMRLLHDVVQSLSVASSVEDLCARVVQAVSDTLGFAAASIYQVAEDSIPQVVASSAYPLSEYDAVNRKMRMNPSLVGKTVKERKIRNTPDVYLDDSWIPIVPSVRSQLDVPIEYGGTLFGALVFEDDSVNAFSKMDEELFSVMARHIAVAWKMHTILDSLMEQTVRDPMTGLWNSRYLRQRMEEEISRARRLGSKFSVVMIDVGNFKSINDRHGHLEGDSMICSIGRNLAAAIRQHDALARYGGDEFVMILSDTVREDAERLVERIQAMEVKTGTGIMETVYLDAGVAVFGEDGDTTEMVLQKADQAMYIRKENRERSFRSLKK